MIDLHLHTTASDGQDAPRDLVRRVRDAGIRTFAVTDHDTLAGLPEAAAEAAACRLEMIPGIEITAVDDGVDVHVLGYFATLGPNGLDRFLEAQRDDRRARVYALGARLAELGRPIDVDRVLAQAASRPGKSLGRPLVARALVEAGHVATIAEAFDRWIGEGRPAFMPRHGASPAEVVRLIAASGGVPSLAHPGPLGRDRLIPGLVDAGLAAIEAYHSEHDTATRARYVALARHHGLAITGGSDFHGPADHRAGALGVVSLPDAELAALRARLASAQPTPNPDPDPAR